MRELDPVDREKAIERARRENGSFSQPTSPNFDPPALREVTSTETKSEKPIASWYEFISDPNKSIGTLHSIMAKLGPAEFPLWHELVSTRSLVSRERLQELLRDAGVEDREPSFYIARIRRSFGLRAGDPHLMYSSEEEGAYQIFSCETKDSA